MQKFISDSIGRSIRVLVIGGKAVSVCEFQDNTVRIVKDFRILSLMGTVTTSAWCRKWIQG